MIQVMLLSVRAGIEQIVGSYRFEHLPRKGDEVIVSARTSEDDVRIFTVGEVVHIAADAVSDWGNGPMTLLRFCEEID